MTLIGLFYCGTVRPFGDNNGRADIKTLSLSYLALGTFYLRSVGRWVCWMSLFFYISIYSERSNLIFNLDSALFCTTVQRTAQSFKRVFKRGFLKEKESLNLKGIALENRR